MRRAVIILLVVVFGTTGVYVASASDALQGGQSAAAKQYKDGCSPGKKPKKYC